MAVAGLPSVKNGVDDGTRTHDKQNHNLLLYQLNYAHHNKFSSSFISIFWHLVNWKLFVLPCVVVFTC